MKTRKHKIASIVLLMIFLSQQISWACGYNFSLLVNPPPSPLIYKDHGEFNRWVAKRVYSLTKPSFRHNPQELKSAYQWLKTPATETVPCSAYVLYNLLQAKGIKPKIEDISASLISLDLKAGNLKPPFTASRIDNSLYAMAKTAESQGLALYPARLNAITPELLNSQPPFIAHLSYGGQSGHFVLVTKIDTEKVYFFYDKGDTFLPYEKFLEEFSGYCLLSAFSLQLSAFSLVSDNEAKSILGAGRSYHGRSVNISSLFKKPSTMESVIGIASAVGGAFSMGGSGYGSLAAMGIKIGGSMIFKDSQWGQIGTSIVAGAVGGGINGGRGASSANMWKEAFQGAGVGAAKSATIAGTMYGIGQIKINGLNNPSFMASLGQLVAVPLGNAVGRGLQMGFDLPLYDGSGNRLGTASELNLNGGFGTGFWQGLTFQTPENGKTGFRDKWGGALQHYGSETAGIAVEVFAPGKYSSAYGMGLNSAFSVFTNTNDSWGKSVGIAIGKGVAMGGASLLLANLTKDMRVTEGAFLEKAASSLVGAGVEAIFGYNKAESVGLTPTSRWGIFSKSLTDNWVNTSKSIVTFGNPSGNFLNYQGSYAIAKMHTFGSDIAALQKGGLKGLDAVRYAWNQYVGSSLHYSAINDISSIAENRMRGVTYANVGKEMHKIEPYTDSWLKSNFGNEAKRWLDLTTGKFLPNQTFSKIDEKTGLRQETTLGKDGNVAVINRFDKDNKLVFSLDLDNKVVYGQGYAYDKIGGKEYVYSGIERQGGRKTGTALKYDHKKGKIIDGTILGIDKSTGLHQKITVGPEGRLIQRFDSAGHKVFELDLANQNQKVMGKVGDNTVEAFKTYQDAGKSPVITTTISGSSGIKAKTMEAYGEGGRKKQEIRSHSIDGKNLELLSRTDFSYDDKNNSVTRTITGADGRQQVITQNFEKIDKTHTGSSGSVEKLEAKRLVSEDVKFLDTNGKQESGKYVTKFEYDKDGKMTANRYDAENNLVSSWRKDEKGKLAYKGLIDNGERIVEARIKEVGNDTTIETQVMKNGGDAEYVAKEFYNNTKKAKNRDIKTYNLGQEGKAEFVTTYGDNGQKKTDLTMSNSKGDKIESKSINDFGQVIKAAYEKETDGNVALTAADNFYEKGEYLKAYDKFSGYSAADKETAAKPAKIEEIKKMDIQSDKLGVWLPGVDTKPLTKSPDVVVSPASAEPKPTDLIVEYKDDFNGSQGWKNTQTGRLYRTKEAAEKDFNKSSVKVPDAPSSASANTGSAVLEIAEGGDEFSRVWTVGNKKFYRKEEAVKYQNTLKAPSGGSPTLQPTATTEPTTSQAVTPTVAPATSPSPAPVLTPPPIASATAGATPSPTVEPVSSSTAEPTPTPQEIKNALSGAGHYTNGWQNLANQIATGDNVLDADYIKLGDLQKKDYGYLSGTSSKDPSTAMIMISSKENKTVSSNVNKAEEGQKNNQALSKDEAEELMARATEGIFIGSGYSNLAAEINSKGPDAVKNRLTGVWPGVNHGEKWVEHIPSGEADKIELTKITTYDPKLNKVVELEIDKDKLLDRPGQGLSNSGKNDVAVVDSEGNQKYVDAEDLKSGINKVDARSESKYSYSTIDMGKDKESLTQKITITDKGRIIERFNGKGETVFKLDLANQKVMGKAEEVNKRDYAKEYSYTPQSDEDILNAELDYMTKKIQKFDGTKGNYERISKDIETSVIFKPQDKDAFKMALGVSPIGGNSVVRSSKAEEANKRDYAKEYSYTPQSDEDILNAEQDYLKNKIAKANQEIYKLNDNIVYGQEDKKGLSDAYDKIYSKMSQEIKNTVVFSPDEKKGLGIGKFEPIEQNLDMAGYSEWKVGDKSFNSINKAKEYQNKQRIQQPAILPNPSPTSNATPTISGTPTGAPVASPSPTPVPTPSPVSSATAATTPSSTLTPAASLTPEPTPTPQPTAQTTPKATGGDYFQDLKRLQKDFESASLDMNSFLKMVERSYDNNRPQDINHIFNKYLPIKEIVRDGTVFYKIQPDEIYKSYSENFRNIEFPSKTLAEKARNIYIKINGVDNGKKFYGHIWKSFSAAREALFKHYNGE